MDTHNNFHFSICIICGFHICSILLQPVLHDRCNSCGMYSPVCGMEHIMVPLLLIEKSSQCSGDTRLRHPHPPHSVCVCVCVCVRPSVSLVLCLDRQKLTVMFNPRPLD